MEDTPTKRLNWGCGKRGEPGWINSDQKAGLGIDISCDIREGLPIDTGSIDYVFSNHALPEVPYNDLLPVIQELRRVIKPGGVLRLSLPDLMKGIEAYQRGDKEYFLIPDEDAESIGAKLIVQLIWYGYTRTLFTEDFARELMEKAGFKDVTICAYRQTSSRFEWITELDNREAESIFIEGVK